MFLSFLCRVGDVDLFAKGYSFTHFILNVFSSTSSEKSVKGSL